MRLIDADSIKFTECINGDITVSKEAIEKMPTAYDVDKVVERLEDKALEHAANGQEYGEDGYDRLEDDEIAIRQGIEEAIEIVKSGGISKE